MSIYNSICSKLKKARDIAQEKLKIAKIDRETKEKEKI